MVVAVACADLVGYVDLASTVQGFVLPVFTAPTVSNSYQVQVLGRQGELAAFSALPNEEKIFPISSDETVALGEEPIWMFQIAPGIVVAERSSKFRSTLLSRLRDEGLLLTSYVKWEVERLFGQTRQRQAAVLELQYLLRTWNAKWARYWLENLLILPTIRERLEAILGPKSEQTSDIFDALNALQISCNASGVRLAPNTSLGQWISNNRNEVQRALRNASAEWQGTGIGARCSLGPGNPAPDLPHRSRKQPFRHTESSTDARDAEYPLFRDGQIIFDKTWPPHQRAVVVGLLEEISKNFGQGNEKRLSINLDRIGPALVVTYATSKLGLKPTRKNPIRMARKASGPRLRLICGSSIEFLRDMFPQRRAAKFETNILFFRNREEADEILVRFKDTRFLLDTISQIWIAEPKVANKQLEFNTNKTELNRKVRFLGYVQPASKRSSLPERLLGFVEEGYYLLLTDDPNRVDAAIIARFLAEAKITNRPGPVNVVVCVVDNRRGSSQRLERASSRIVVLHVVSPPMQLIQRARAIFCHLASFSAGIFRSVQRPIVFVRGTRRRDSGIDLAAAILNAAVVDVSTKDLESNRPGIRAALSSATHQSEFGEAKRRYSACRGGARAIQLYGELVGAEPEGALTQDTVSTTSRVHF